MSVLLWILLLIVISAVIISTVPKFRIRLVTLRILKYFRYVLPPIHDTERDAIEAGHVWWEGELFRGNPDWQKLAAIPKAQLTQEEQDFLNNQVESLCTLLDDWEIVTQGQFPPAVWDFLKQERFFGLTISKQYGGLGFSALAQSHIISKISSRSSSVGVTVMVPNALGPAEFLQHYGTDEQRNYYLPRLAQGLEIPAFALTSPESGSDASHLRDTGIVCEGDYEGKQVLGIRLCWSKRYITLAPLASLIVLAVKLYDPQLLLGQQEDIGITLCLVPTHLPGVTTGARHSPLGLAFLNGPTAGKDVFIPLEFVIGGVEYCGQGWRMLMEGLAAGRGISLPALSTAAAKLCYRMTGVYASIREQFGVPIGQFEGIEEALATIGGFTYQCEAARLFTLDGINLGIKPALVAAIAKYHITEMARVVVDLAMDIHAGRGIQLGPRNYLGLLYQFSPIGITVEGANILTRNLIIFGQGAMRCHPFLQEEVAAANQPDVEAVPLFDALLCRHLRYVVINLFRVVAYGLTGGLLIHSPLPEPVAQYTRQLTRMSAALALSTDVILAVLGGQLKRKERISARLGDVLSQLFLASAAIKYYLDCGQPQEDQPFLHWTLRNCLYKMQVALDNLLHNFRPRWLGCLMHFLIFPWGRAYKPPEDKMDHALATAVMTFSAQRDRLTEHCHISQNVQDATGRMERISKILTQTEQTREKLRQAIAKQQIPKSATELEQITLAEQLGICSENEIQCWKELAELRWEAIQVDEFRT